MRIKRLWVSGSVNNTLINQREALHKLMLHDGQVEQYTETLPRRWWQLKAATRIRIRRVQPQTINCRCSMASLPVGHGAVNPTADT